jgi:hypothetical protein
MTSSNRSKKNQLTLLKQAIKNKDQEGMSILLQKTLEASNVSDMFSPLGAATKAEIDEIASLILGVNPQDTVEMVLACQFVSTHLQSLSKLTQDETSHGMMLMRLSHQALETLQKYRNKGSNINVNYFVQNEGQALIQTNIEKNLKKKGK